MALRITSGHGRVCYPSPTCAVCPYRVTFRTETFSIIAPGPISGDGLRRSYTFVPRVPFVRHADVRFFSPPILESNPCDVYSPCTLQNVSRRKTARGTIERWGAYTPAAGRTSRELWGMPRTKNEPTTAANRRRRRPGLVLCSLEVGRKTRRKRVRANCVGERFGSAVCTRTRLWRSETLRLATTDCSVFETPGGRPSDNNWMGHPVRTHYRFIWYLCERSVVRVADGRTVDDRRKSTGARARTIGSQNDHVAAAVLNCLTYI